MAVDTCALTIYDRNGLETLYSNTIEVSSSDTIGDILSYINIGVTAISLTKGGSIVDNSSSAPDILNSGGSSTVYDATIHPGCHLEEDYSAMQGPCPAGFHVPLKTERQALYNAGESLGLRTSSSGAINCSTYLKLPFAGMRALRDGNYVYQSTSGYYWSSSHESGTSWISYYFYININGGVTPQDDQICTDAYSIRCFKDSPVEPDDSWTKIYDGSSVASGAGIFHNTTLGLISLSGDGTTWYTIQDKNLGATQVYNYGDTLSEANCGKYYQWGNNYGFPRTGTVTTSSTRVDASNYGPGNYYSGSTFIIRTSNPRGWYSGSNHNLWGGETGVTYTEICPTYRLHGYIGTWHMEWVPESYDYSAMRGPCNEGFHVPLSSEWTAVKTIWTTLGGGGSAGTNFSANLKLPMAGYREYTSSASGQGSYGLYWASTKLSDNLTYSYCMYIYSNYISVSSNPIGRGQSIRPFKDKPVVPTNSWTKLYGTSIEAGGIFWNSTDGLISLSSNGTTWITIADKNVGATTVWNSGDTLSAANCGYYFQRGNNYGFSRTGSVTKSSTQVDASTYGPGNYYSSSNFITNNKWETSDNKNLRGGVTGIIPGHYRPRQPVVLKTYEEIVAMATAEGRPWTNTIAELNTNVEGYFNILNEGNHLSIGTPKVPEQSGYYIKGITSSGYYIRKDISGPLDHNGLWYYEIEE